MRLTTLGLMRLNHKKYGVHTLEDENVNDVISEIFDNCLGGTLVERGDTWKSKNISVEKLRTIINCVWETLKERFTGLLTGPKMPIKEADLDKTRYATEFDMLIWFQKHLSIHNGVMKLYLSVKKE